MAELDTPAVRDFLAILDNDRREGFLAYAEQTYSVYEIWLYAGVLGYEGGFTELERWVQAHYPKLNRRALLLNQVELLERDIQILRQHIEAGLLAPADAATRIAHLSKELRGHIIEIEKTTKALDRRGLILAGADRVMREVKTIFRGNDEVIDALNLAYESVWALLTEEK